MSRKMLLMNNVRKLAINNEKNSEMTGNEKVRQGPNYLINEKVKKPSKNFINGKSSEMARKNPL